MKSKNKYIGINNRIPFVVLEGALYDFYVNGEISKEALYNHIKEFTEGENRAKKSLANVNKIFTSNKKLIGLIRKNLGQKDFYHISNNEKRIMLLCLFCLTYPITYDLLCALAGGFKVESKLNKLYIHQKIGAIYGGNRSMHIAVDEVMPLLIELNLLEREKIGIYIKSKKIGCSSNFFTELIIYTDIMLSKSKSILLSDLTHRPWYSYFDFSISNLEEFEHLILVKDSAIGKGYIIIRTS